MNEYRITEFCGAFTIEVKGHEEKGILWWKKREWSWFRCNLYGGVIQVWPIVQTPCKSFKTLEDAEKRVKEFKKGVTYHNA